MQQESNRQEALARHLWWVLAESVAVPDVALAAHLAVALGQCPGVTGARLLRPGEPAQEHQTLVLPLVAQGRELGALVLQGDDELALAPHGIVWASFATVLAHVLHSRCGVASASAGTEPVDPGEKRFRDLFDHSPDPCWLIDRGQFTDCNHAAVQALGYTRREDILQHPSRLSPEFQPDGRPSFEKAEEAMTRALREGVVRFEWEHRRADGSCFPVEVTLARIELQGRDILYCV